MNKFITGQDAMKDPSSNAICGFNFRVYGHSYNDCFQHPHERSDGARHAGWNLADKMIADGRLFFVHNFHNLTCPTGHAFPYGGFWVCNECGGNRLEQEWWKIKVMKDGNAWCCIGTGFENLQESDNYAFGDTREDAIENYGKQMLKARES